MRTLLLVFAILMTLWAADARGQNEPNQPPDVREQSKASDAALPQPDRAAMVQAMLDRSRLLDDVHFTVPIHTWRDYLRARDEAAGIVEPPPVASILSEAEYHVTIQADSSAILVATLRWHIFKPAECRNLPVLTAGMAWTKVTLNGQAAELATVDGWLRFTPTEPGPVVLSAEVPLKGSPLTLAIPQSIKTFVRVDAPGALEFALAGLPQTVTGAAEGGTHGRLSLTPRDKLELSWQPPRVHYEKPPRYQLAGDVIWTLAAGSQKVEAHLLVSIIGGSTDRIDLTLPAGADRVEVTGPDVREVQTSGDRAAVFLRGKIAEKTRLAVSLELPAVRGGSAKLEGFSVTDGQWTGGTLVVTNAAGGSEVLPQTATGLADIVLTQIPSSASAMMAAAPALAYAITSRQWSAGVETIDLGEYALRETVADIAHYEVTFRPDGTLMCKASYEIRNRTQQFLRFDLPRGSQVLLVRVNEKPQPLTPVAGTEDAYQVPLVRSMASVKGLVSFPVEIVLLCRAEPLETRGQARLPLPRINMPIAYAWCEAYLPREMETASWTGPLGRVQQFSSETATASLDYGRGELAEGYSEAQRPKFDKKADEARRREEEAREKPAKPQNLPGLFGYPFAEKDVRDTGKAPAEVTQEDARRKVTTIVGGGVTETGDKIELPTVKMTHLMDESDGKDAKVGILKLDNTSLRDLNAAAATGKDVDLVLPDKLSLARNYFRAGRDFYEQGDFDNAAKSLEQASKLAPGSVEATNASRLMGNIDVQRGKTQATGQAEKAAAAEVSKGLAFSNSAVIAEQQKRVEEGETILKQGRRDQALAQFEAAKALGEKLTEQGVDVREQQVQLAEINKRIDELKGEKQSQILSYEKRASELKKEGRYEEALQTLQQAPSGGSGAVLKKELTELTYQTELQRAERSRALKSEQQQLQQQTKDTFKGAAVTDLEAVVKERGPGTAFDPNTQALAKDKYEAIRKATDLEQKVRLYEERIVEQEKKLGYLEHNFKGPLPEDKVADSVKKDAAADFNSEVKPGAFDNPADPTAPSGEVIRGMLALRGFSAGRGGGGVAGGGGAGQPASGPAAALAEGDTWLAAGDLNSARQAYARALQLDNTNAAAKVGILKLDAMAGHGSGSLLVREADRMSLEAGRLQAQVRETISAADRSVKAGRGPGEQAEEMLTYARRLIDQSSTLTPDQAEDLRKEVQAQRDTWVTARSKETTEQTIELHDSIKQLEPLRADDRRVKVDAAEASVLGTELYGYPDARTWAELSAKRKKFVQGASGESEAVRVTRQKLRTKGIIDGAEWSISINVTATPLGSVLDFLAEAARAKPREITIVIDRAGIAAAGVNLDNLIDIQVKDVSIEQALKMLLGDRLGYFIQDDGRVVISSRQRLQQDLPVTSYSVGDLVKQVPDFSRSAPRMNVGPGQDAGGLFSDSSAPQDEDPGIERLKTLIERTVRSSEPWESMGGRAAIEYDSETKSLIVQQTPDGQKKLEDLLENLRRELPMDQRLGGEVYESGRVRLRGQVTQVYDVRSLRGTTAADSDADKKLETMFEDVLRAGDGRESVVKIVNGRAIVTGDSNQQMQALGLLRRLESVQGPQVEQGQTLALQQARRGEAGQTADSGGVPNRVVFGSTAYYLSGRQALNATDLTGGGRYVTEVPPEWSTHRSGTDGGWSYDNPADFYWDALPKGDTMSSAGVAQPQGPAGGDEWDQGAFARYLDYNYDWQLSAANQRGRAPALGDVPVLGRLFSNRAVVDRTFSNGATFAGSADTVVAADLARKLQMNLGQNVRVNSIDLGVTAAQASSLGVTFTEGANGLRYATADEAQFRTLAELAARQIAGNGDNSRSQFTIIGTDALLSNGMTANVRYAGDRTNTLDIADNDFQLENERYVLIDNGGTVTAVRADRMQHWTELPSSNPFAVVPQTIEVPRVGQRVKLEKTLVEPTDELVIQVEYVWKGATR